MGITIFLIGMAVAVPQDELAASGGASSSAPASATGFVLKMTQVGLPALDDELTQRLQSGTDLEATIDELAKQNRLVSYDQVHVTIYDGLVTKAQFGRRVPRVAGTSLTQFGRVNSVNFEEIGTLVKVAPRFEPETGDVIVVLEYEASRFSQADDAEAVSSTDTLKFTSTVRLKLEQPVLVTSNQRRTTTLLIAELKRLGDFKPPLPNTTRMATSGFRRRSLQPVPGIFCDACADDCSLEAIEFSLSSGLPCTNSPWPGAS